MKKIVPARMVLPALAAMLAILLATACSRLPGRDDGLPPARDVLALMHKVNDWQKANPVMKPDDRNWARGTWYTGVMAAYKATGDERFLEQARAWGRRHAWQVGTESSGGNKLTCTQTWLELYFIAGLESGGTKSMRGALVWYKEQGRRYADSLYVGPPALAMLARATGDARYLDAMHAFFWDVHAELFDREEQLFYRDHRYIGQQSPNGKKILWSRGNGWVFGGLARILEYLPEDDPQRPRYVALYRQMAEAIASRQPEDGLWRPNLDDPDSPAMPETSGTGFFCYGLAWGINRGLLDRPTYLPVVRKAWAGLESAVSPAGKVRWGQLVAGQPNPIDREDTHEYVAGTFLLAGSEVYRLAKGD